MSSINATPSIVVKFLSVETRTVKYEYEGKTRTTHSFQELLERAKNAGITVLYTQPVKRYMAEQSKLRREQVVTQYDHTCTEEKHVQANVACDTFDWTLIKGIGPVTALKLYNAGFTQLSHIGAYELGTEVLECICTPTQVDALMQAWQVDKAWSSIGITI